tara:strand:+ start:815 stop:952 length:138 start_codon:yes stop_codon:yes gene_type:complete
MTQIEAEKNEPIATDGAQTSSSDGDAEFYIDPVKERKMMRKFDVS